MREKKWVALVIEMTKDRLRERDASLEIAQGKKLPYASEIRFYEDEAPQKHRTISYETDMLVFESLDSGQWKPRLVIEAKLSRITTHAAITYSEKASTHKQVHPYLRYGILIGNRRHYPLPGRLFRHGAYFDFMLSWKAHKPSPGELDVLLELIFDEVQASRDLEEIIYSSRSPYREKYTFLHRPLRLKKVD